MSKKMVKLLSSSLIAMGALVVGCSESNSSGPVAESGEGVFLKNDSKQMWARINESGSIATYFDSLSKEGGIPAIGVTTNSRVRCDAPALKMDENTRYLDELESLFDEGEQVEGVCGKAIKLSDGQVAPLGVNLIDSLSVGTVEFWFRPNADFYDKKARTLLGNDGARVHFFYKDGSLYFQKNHHNQHYYVNGAAKLKNDWNLIAGQWGDGYMSLWLNGEMVAKVKHDKGYVPALRGIPFENLVVIGYKSSCCMEGPGQYESMTTSGSYDQVKISNIPRYKITDTTTVAQDTLVTDTTAEEFVFVPDTNWVVDYEFNYAKNVGMDYSGHGYHAVVAEGAIAVDSGKAYFNGKSGLKLAEGKKIQLGDFAVEARVYPEDVSGFRNILVTEPPGFGPDGWILRFEDGSLKFFVRDADWGTDWQNVSVDGVEPNQWYDIRVECTSKAVRIFLNDSLKIEKDIAGNYDGLLYPWGVGYDAVNQSAHNRYFLGYVDYIRVAKLQREDAPADTAKVPADTAKTPIDTTASDSKCFEMDLNTLFLDELDYDNGQGTLIDGVCGKGVALKSNESYSLDFYMKDALPAGTAEFWFRPGEDFYDEARSLFGNDGARVHFFYKDGQLVFQKNHDDVHNYVKAQVALKNDWNLIAGQWGDGYMSLWVNGKLVAKVAHNGGYQPASRGVESENLLVLGRKNSCCMEGPGQYQPMHTSGAYDQVRISMIPRYDIKAEVAE